jgi:hypothetical protein
MAQAKDVVEKFVKPWLEKNHPNADLVILAGSFGRAMKQDSWQPIASSDLDLVIIYSDLEKGGFKAATQVFKYEEVGTVLGEDKPREMMIDTNVHDLASLHYHDKIVKENTNFAFMNVMLDEGYIVRDRLGIGPVLQQKAKKFLDEGPAPTPQGRWQGEIDTLQSYLDGVRKTDSTEEKRFLGAMALIHTCEYALGLHQYWRSGSNQAYRRLTRFFPEEEKVITEAFSDLIRNGKTEKFEALMDDYITRGKALLPTLPVGSGEPLYPVDRYVPKQEATEIRDMFLKFMTDHLCEALETSQKRGELAHLENLSSSLNFIKMAIESKEDVQGGQGVAAMRYLEKHYPDIMPQTLNALDHGEFEPIRAAAGDALKHMGGLSYRCLENYYADDIARVNAAEASNDNAPKAPTKHFHPKFS